MMSPFSEMIFWSSFHFHEILFHHFLSLVSPFIFRHVLSHLFKSLFLSCKFFFSTISFHILKELSFNFLEFSTSHTSTVIIIILTTEHSTKHFSHHTKWSTTRSMFTSTSTVTSSSSART